MDKRELLKLLGYPAITLASTGLAIYTSPLSMASFIAIVGTPIGIKGKTIAAFVGLLPAIPASSAIYFGIKSVKVWIK